MLLSSICKWGHTTARQGTFKKSSTKRVPLAHLRLRLRSSYRHFGRYPARLPRPILRSFVDCSKWDCARTLAKLSLIVPQAQPEPSYGSGGRGEVNDSATIFYPPCPFRACGGKIPSPILPSSARLFLYR